MAITHLPRQTLAVLAAMALLLPGAGSAHEGHKHDTSDAEMVQMEGNHAPVMDDHAIAAIHDRSAKAQGHRTAEDVVAHQTPAQALEAAVAANRLTSIGDFLGRLHPIAAHFPVALLQMAALAELLLVLRSALALALDTTVRFLVAGGAIGAVMAALLGWFAAGWRLLDKSQTLGLHRWNGSAIAGAALIATWFAFKSNRRTGLRVTLASLAIALVIQGYLGGEMVFGPNHLGLE